MSNHWLKYETKHQEILRAVDRVGRESKENINDAIANVTREVREQELRTQMEIMNLAEDQRRQTAEIVSSVEWLAGSIGKGLGRVAQSIDSFHADFHWGIARLIEALALVSNQLQEIIKILRAPKGTQAEEMRTKGETAYKNMNLSTDSQYRQYWLEEAIRCLQEAEELNRTDFSVHLMLATILFHERKTPLEALPYYRKAAFAARPYSSRHSGWSYLCIALIYQLNDQLEESLKNSKEAVELCPDWDVACFEHARYCALIGDASETIKYLKMAAQCDMEWLRKAALDTDFDKVREKINKTLEELRDQLQLIAKTAMTKLELQTNSGIQLGLFVEETSRAQLSTLMQKIERHSIFDYCDAIEEISGLYETQAGAFDKEM